MQLNNFIFFAAILTSTFGLASAACAQDSLIAQHSSPVPYATTNFPNVLYPPISYDGRYLAFYSTAALFGGREIEKPGQVFVSDRKAGTTQLLSVAADGTPANGASSYPTISGDGHFVTFTSVASNLVEGDTQNSSDVFETDVSTRETVLVSRTPEGKPAGGYSYGYFPSISADGRYVVFNSDSPNLDPADDTNGTFDVYLFDRDTGKVKLISKNAAGKAGNGPSMHAVISGNGRYVAFHSRASDLIANDTNGVSDVFLVDLSTGGTIAISRNAAGELGNKRSERPGISFDGNRVSFSTDATNLVPADTNNSEDVFVYDQSKKSLILASVAPDGSQFVDAGMPMKDRKSVVSGDGQFVAFRSSSSTAAHPSDDPSIQLYVRDLGKGTTSLTSTLANGQPIPGNAEHHSINFDGSVIAFTDEVTSRDVDAIARSAPALVPMLSLGRPDTQSIGFVVDKRQDKMTLFAAPAQ